MSALWLLLLGSVLIINNCDARAVNISNTWTLPQEGFSVFYRFFRDKISWFEADAVCQFHHGNLVTVETGIQFDASRAFLKELDVTEPVWIGLMRAQNSNKFSWTNTKPSDFTTGYWAEPLPILKSPLCAVIDPVRDFRWHALRCGGPETAAFLCELNVPIWASECTIRAMPALTIQYMTDSGTIQLSRDCGDDGDRRIMTCQGKQDHDIILKTLSCSDEQNSLTSENDITVKTNDLPLVKNEIVPVTSSDNTENNNIDLTNGIESSGDEKIINKFDLENMMMGDQHVEEEKKKIVVVPKKDTEISKKKIMKNKIKEDVMLGDQPVSNESSTIKSIIEEHLPHNKKSLVQDLKHLEVSTAILPSTFEEILSTTEQFVFSTTEVENIATTFSPELVEETNITKRDIVGTTETSEIISESTTTVPLTTEVIPPSTTATTTIAPVSTSVAVEVTQKTPIGIHHPIPQSYHHKNDESVSTTTVFNKITNPTLERTTTQHHENPTSKDHFIPPMLLVKAQFLSTKPHIETTTQPPKTESTPTENSIQSSTNEILETSSIPAVSDKIDEEIISKATSEAVTTDFSTMENQENFTSNKLSNAENFQPYKPNRRRALTKPESEHRSYVKKILG